MPNPDVPHMVTNTDWRAIEPMFRLLITLFILNLLFVAVAWPLAHSSVLPLLAAEAFLLTGLFLWLPRTRWQQYSAVVVGILFVAAALLVGFDRLTQTSLGRPLVVYLDLPLLRSAYDLSLTNLGIMATITIALGGSIAIMVLITLFTRLLTQLPDTTFTHKKLAAGVFGGVGAILLAVSSATGSPVSAAGIQAIWQQAERTTATIAGNQSFADETDELATSHQPVRLDQLEHRDVLLVFIESYGMQALTQPEYAPKMDNRLQQMQASLNEHDLGVVSGRLQAPIEGGQSWLAHGTVLSGLWIDNQIDYETMLDSGVPTLVDDFNATGHETMAVMPANTRDWPPGRQYGFDQVFDATTMDYQGPAMNFFTMPDQYTLSWLQHQILVSSNTPVFAEVPLISSHAPWVPVLPVLDWDDIGDGSVFHGMGEDQPSPEALFQDQSAVKDFYIRSVDYSLQVTTEFATRYLNEDALLVVIGDHEAPPMVTGSDVNREVPFHLVSGDADLLDDLLSASEETPLGATLQSGTWPDMNMSSDEHAAGMDDLRQAFHHWFSRTAQ